MSKNQEAIKLLSIELLGHKSQIHRTRWGTRLHRILAEDECMAADPNVANLTMILDVQQTVSESSWLKPTSLLPRIAALLDGVFEMAFGDDEEIVANSLRGL